MTKRLPPTSNTVLLVGTNNLRRDSARCIVAGIRAVVDAVKTRLPRTRLYVVGILPRVIEPADLAEKIPAVNQMLASGIGYRFIDATRVMQGGGLFLADGLHLTPAGYQRLASMIDAELQRATR